MILLLTTIKQIPLNFSNIFISRFVSPPESHGRDIKLLFTLVLIVSHYVMFTCTEGCLSIQSLIKLFSQLLRNLTASG